MTEVVNVDLSNSHSVQARFTGGLSNDSNQSELETRTIEIQFLIQYFSILCNFPLYKYNVVII
jgi:hypothetical protein